MEPGIVLFTFISIFLYYSTLPIFWLISYLNPRERLPPIIDPLLLTSATNLAASIRSRKVTSLQVVKAFIRRIKEINPYINAVVDDRFKAARKQAKKIDNFLDNCTTDQIAIVEKFRPLMGVPVTIKESCSLKGMPLVIGSIKRLGTRARQDSLAVSRLKDAGAIPLLVSTTPEMCMSWQTFNFVTGTTKNPYDTTRTPGGSSGGEGALISAGGSVIGIGSDIGGSVRIPAMCCGIFGHKPTPGIIPVDGHCPNEPYNDHFKTCMTVGPITRYAQDLEIMLQILAGDDFQKLNPDKQIEVRKIKVFYMYQAAHDTYLHTHKSVKKVIMKAKDYLEMGLCMDVKQANFNLNQFWEMTFSMFLEIGYCNDLLLDENTGKHRNVYLEILKTIIGCGNYTLEALEMNLFQKLNGFMMSGRRDEYKEKALRVKEEIIEQLGSNGLLIFPTLTQSAPYHHQMYIRSTDILYATVFNVFGMPSTHVPMGLDENGLPVGFQVVAAPNCDRLCIALAKELEKAFGGWVQPF